MERRILVTLLAAALFCAATVLSSHGAISAPNTPSNSAAQFQADSLSAQQSEWRRVEVGKMRYQKKLQHRASVIAGLRAELEKQQALVVAPPANTQDTAVEQSAGQATAFTIWALVVLAGILLFRRSWVRALAKEKPKSFQPVKPVIAPISTRPIKTPDTKTAVKPAAKPPPRPPTRPALAVDVIDLDRISLNSPR